jgi:hypothetical protein
LDRIDGDAWEVSFQELRKIGKGYEERPPKRPNWYGGEQRWLDQAEVAKFPG